MQESCNSHQWPLVLALISLVALNGCANLAAVRTFADDTKKLSAAFDPMLAGASASCTDKYIRKKLITSTHFDPAAVEQAAAELCGPIEADNQVVARLNLLLEQYADTLAALADDKLPSYKTELDGLTASLGKVRKAGSQESLVSPDKLGAVAALSEFLSRIATRHLQKEAIRDLLNHEAAIQTVTNALKEYATLNYRAWLRDERRENEVLYRSLDRSNETLAANYLKTVLLNENRKIAEREKAIDGFVTAVDQFQKANAEIRRKFEYQDDKELIAELTSFAKEVSRLRQQIHGAF